MLKKTPILSLIALIVVMVACKKTTDKVVTPPVVALTGTWNLAGIDVTQSTTIIGLPTDSTDSIRVVYADSYPMSTVTGNLVFTSDSLYVNGLSYSAQPQLNLSVYAWPSNVLDSTTTQDGGTISQDSTNLAFPFANVSGKDSISFPQGGIVYPAVAFQVPLTSRGASYAFVGDTLKMTIPSDTTLAGSSFGPSSTISYFGADSRLVLKLVKK